MNDEWRLAMIEVTKTGKKGKRVKVRVGAVSITLSEKRASVLLMGLADVLRVLISPRRELCDYCGNNEPIAVDDSGRPYCGDCAIYACRLPKTSALR